jgi:hypothetical protein
MADPQHWRADTLVVRVMCATEAHEAAHENAVLHDNAKTAIRN